MISDFDIWRAANLLIREHRGDAEIVAAQRADEMLARREFDHAAPPHDKNRRRQLAEDGNVEITGRDLRERTPPGRPGRSGADLARTLLDLTLSVDSDDDGRATIVASALVEALPWPRW